MIRMAIFWAMLFMIVANVPLAAASSTGSSLPTPLSDADVERYRKIFTLQQDKKWKQANAVIKTLDDRLLMGRVLAQRYLHPTGWRSSYKELRDWLSKYNDHPAATRIYRLAQKRRPANYKYPEKPKSNYLNGYGRAQADTYYLPIPASYSDRLSPDTTRSIARDIRQKIRSGWPTGAYNILNKKESRRYLTKYEEALLYSDIAHGYFIYGKDDLAIKVAKKAIKLSDGKVDRAYWIAGLAAWRQSDVTFAKSFFRELADRDNIDDHGLAAAAAYWASRAELRAGQADRSIGYLQRASLYQDTFYGMLATEALGQDITLNFSLPLIDGNYIAWLNAKPGGRRTFALLQVGETYHASRELRYLWKEHREEDRPRLMALAASEHMAGLAFRIAGIMRDTSHINRYGGLFPIADFNTDAPIRVDPALLLAIMRQESGFNPRAQSWATASGLMQLMPATAAYIAGDRGYRNTKRHDLLIPEINIRLGEDYILYLLNDTTIESNMIRLLTAYNAGPGNLRKWMKKVNHRGDTLMLLESLPSRETRFYVKNVMTNLWIYRKRLGQDANEVASLAADGGARFVPQITTDGCQITNLAQICH